MSTIASRAAYQDQLPLMRGKRAKVFEVIGLRGPHGMTIREAMDALEWPHTTVSARIFELAEAGVLCPRGDTRQDQSVWVVTPADRVEYYREERRKAREKRKSPAHRTLEREHQQLRVAAANLAGYAASLKQDGTPNTPEWVAGVIERIEKVQGLLGIA